MEGKLELVKRSKRTNVIYEGDCIEVMATCLKSQSVDLIFADPPYNLSGNALTWVDNKTGGPWFMMNEKWDSMSDVEYEAFTARWLAQCARVLKPQGAIFVACSYHNLGEVVMVLKRLEFRLNNVITWYKLNAMPNMTRRVFTHSTEFVVWGVRNQGWKFNYDTVKAINPERRKDGGPKQMRDMWPMPLVQGKERQRGKDGRAAHPTQKPEEMLKRIVLACSDEGDVVLDPFLGAGTTSYVAQQNRRRWIGIEQNPEYVSISCRRMGIDRCEVNIATPRAIGIGR